MTTACESGRCKALRAMHRLATLACPAGPWDEPARGPVLGGSGPRGGETRRLALSRTAVDGLALLVPRCLELPHAVSGCLMLRALPNLTFRKPGASEHC